MSEGAGGGAKMGEDTKLVLVGHAALVGLTPLIPVPLLDDAVKGYLERRLVVELGKKHGMELDKPVVAALTSEDGSLLKSIGVGIVTLPFKLIFRKLFVVLEVKRASDEASLAYHRGWLFDKALAAGAMQPAGPRSPTEVRAAIETSLAGAVTSPASSVIRGVFEGSKSLLGNATKALLKSLRKDAPLQERDLDTAVSAAQAGPFSGVVDRLKRAMDELPDEHFKAIETRFEALLGVELRKPTPP